MSEEDEIDILEENEPIEKPAIQKKKKAFENPAPKVVIKKRGSAPVRQHKEESEEDDEEEENISQRQHNTVKEGGSEPLGSDAKPKRERTQKQIEAFNKCIETKKKKAAERAAEAKRLAEYDRKALEEKVVKKAISIKKKQIKKQSALDEISDDDTPIEKVKEVAKTIKPVAPVKPVVAFKFI
jgi:hypothetical protein